MRTSAVDKRKSINIYNTLDIMNDALKARENGVTYGQYKAGIRPAEEESEYSVSKTEFVKKTESVGPVKKGIAFIK